MNTENSNTEFELWFKDNKHSDGIQRLFKGVIKKNPDYPLTFKDWCKKYFNECVDV